MNIHFLSVASIGISLLSSTIIIIDLAVHKAQKMKVMNVVWPLTALYSGLLGLAAYYFIGRKAAHDQSVSWQSITTSTLHCGSGCALGDLIAECFTVFFPITLFASPIFATWLADYIAAIITGAIFQFMAIRSMRQISFAKALLQAFKADVLSLTFWQLGMYGWMAIAVFGIYRHPLAKSSPLFWFMMQIAMLLGFVTSYPINWWLLKKRIKEPM